MPKRSTSTAKRRPKAKRAPRSRPRRVRNARAIEATLADLAHDIRTPLAGILALGELLATSDLGARERGWAVAIKSTAEHLALLSNLIVDAARADAKGLVLRRDLIRPRGLAEAIATSLAARAESKGIGCEVAIADGLPAAVIGDSPRLRSALENLIDNAVKFTERGQVRFGLSSETAPRGRARLIFTVSDSGIGLRPAEIRRLFRPFAQANETIARRYGGAGLGLAFVKRIAIAMGGDLTVAREPRGGSRFQFSVVVKVAPAGAGADGTAAAPAASSPPLSILCAEDNPYGRVVLNTILAELGHKVDFAGTGEAAVAAVARGSYDAVLMDVTLPGVDGIEATRRIRALPKPAGGIAIVGMSGRVKPADEAAGRAAGMDAYLAKPLSPRMLSELLAGLGGRARAAAPP
jgi:CheY-like chemotaxis protein/nitrogen-specific signal transduction histidine kinase